ncbi:SDR family NAD(P)-dependent oxidoreductase [Sutcliffiella horikoshii]|uniref:SDR family NAD(P)-dependent oxidoreductase n=1 Tax=Sutcliffiella horikoshii TaxID=79883 RepID=UPI001F325B94|nr:SDR family oxidoreductase [Sutcliffiella horikoshii]MCG1023385.1 SDR family oxidoreductase [Sutcliffiella horikoshii]
MTKTAVITGASSGLGLEFVKLFAKDGYNLVVIARSEEKLLEIKKSYPNINVTVIPKDLSKPDAIKEIVHEMKKHDIKVDVLVNNAGFGLLGSFESLSVEQQLNMIQLNVSSLTELTYHLLPELKKSKSGKILNVASTAAFQPGPNMAVYYATKAFVLSFSEALAEELKEDSITVTTLCPGATKTNFSSVANVGNTKMFSNAMPSEIVAKQGYQALMRGKRVVITGRFNKVGALAAKFLPRQSAAKVAKLVMKEN